MDVYRATKYVSKCCEDLYASDYKARDAADLFGYIRGLDASEIVVYEDLYKLLTILTGTCIRIITEMEVKSDGYKT